MPQPDVRVEPVAAMPDERISAGEQVFEAWRKRLGALLTLPLFFLTYFLCSNLRPEGRTLAAILAAVTTLWVSEVIPLPVSALVGAVLCVALGVVPQEPGKRRQRSSWPTSPIQSSSYSSAGSCSLGR